MFEFIFVVLISTIFMQSGANDPTTTVPHAIGTVTIPSVTKLPIPAPGQLSSQNNATKQATKTLRSKLKR